MSIVSASLIDDGLARRNAIIFSVAQALYGASSSVLITVGGLVGYSLISDKSYATFPITSMVIGVAITTIPAALFMRRVGRRAGFMLGASFGIFGAVLGTYAIWVESFVIFCLATVFLGAYQGFAGYYRFAAADIASESFKSRAVSWVLAGGVAAAFLGPALVIWTRNAIPEILYAGSFLAMCALSLVAVAILSFVKIPHVNEKIATRGARPLSQILAQPKLLIAIFCCMVSYSAMNLVMTSTPLAMVAHAHTVDNAAIVIQWHIVAMYAPSFFTGALIERFGKENVIATGMVLLTLSGLVALAGVGMINFWLTLVLLGVGWNFGFIGGTTLVLDCYRTSERNKVQATCDFSTFAMVGVASFTSGYMLHAFGWQAVQYTMFPLVIVVFFLILYVKYRANGDQTV